MHPVGLVERQPGVRGHRRVVAQDVLQRRDARARRVGGVTGLGELLRVAEQDQVPRRPGHRQEP